MSRVVIGMDPHKRSATIEAIDDRERVLARGCYGTDSDGYRAMLAAGSPTGCGRSRDVAASAGTSRSV